MIQDIKCLPHCKTNVNTIFDEKKCDSLNPRNHVKLVIREIREWMIKAKGKNWQPYVGARASMDDPDPYVFPFHSFAAGLREEYQEKGYTVVETLKKVNKQLFKQRDEYKRKLAEWIKKQRKAEEKAEKKKLHKIIQKNHLLNRDRKDVQTELVKIKTPGNVKKKNNKIIPISKSLIQL